MPKKKKTEEEKNNTPKEIIVKENEKVSKEEVSKEEAFKEEVSKENIKEVVREPMSEKKKAIKLYFPKLRNHLIVTAKGNIKIDDKGTAEVSEELMKFLLQFKAIEFKKVD